VKWIKNLLTQVYLGVGVLDDSGVPGQGHVLELLN